MSNNTIYISSTTQEINKSDHSTRFLQEKCEQVVGAKNSNGEKN